LLNLSKLLPFLVKAELESLRNDVFFLRRAPWRPTSVSADTPPLCERCPEILSRPDIIALRGSLAASFSASSTKPPEPAAGSIFALTSLGNAALQVFADSRLMSEEQREAVKNVLDEVNAAATRVIGEPAAITLVRVHGSRANGSQSVYMADLDLALSGPHARSACDVFCAQACVVGFAARPKLVQCTLAPSSAGLRHVDFIFDSDRRADGALLFTLYSLDLFSTFPGILPHLVNLKAVLKPLQLLGGLDGISTVLLTLLLHAHFIRYFGGREPTTPSFYGPGEHFPTSRQPATTTAFDFGQMIESFKEWIRHNEVILLSFDKKGINLVSRGGMDAASSSVNESLQSVGLFPAGEKVGVYVSHPLLPRDEWCTLTVWEKVRGALVG
jgi:hypothetical protein